MDESLDCLIIGGGPAGLTAAIYLARFRRNILLVDKGSSRARYIPTSHNYPGFAQGISGHDFLAALRTQAAGFGARLSDGEITGLTRRKDCFAATADGRDLLAKTVLLATGVVDGKPALPGGAELIYSGVVRFCPICDGYEAMDKRVGVIGPLHSAKPKALFLRSYTNDIMLLVTGEDIAMTEEDQSQLLAVGIELPRAGVADIIAEHDGVRAIMADGTRIDLDVLYPAMGAKVQTQLAAQLGARTNEKGCLFTDAYQCTTIPGLYAGGDVTFDISQIAVATGQAAIAATAIHNALLPNPREAAPS
jgi:thioredoxin reductase (NADPH)